MCDHLRRKNHATIILSVILGLFDDVSVYSIVNLNLRRKAENDAKAVFTCADSAIKFTLELTYCLVLLNFEVNSTAFTDYFV